MRYKSTESGFGLISIMLHWTMAVLFTGLFALGLYMVELDYYDPFYHEGPWWHTSFGVIMSLLVVIRIGWRSTETTPSPLPSYQPWELIIAKIAHKLMYLLLLAICISGYFISTAKGTAIEVFHLFELPAMLIIDEHTADSIAEIHEIANWSLVIVLSLHIAAAFKHQLIDKDGTLLRMLNPNK